MQDDADPPGGEPEGFRVLADELKREFRSWMSDPVVWPAERVDELARRTFALQVSGNRAYGSYCRRLGVAPPAVHGWRDVPPVPTAAFREVPLVVGEPRDAVLEFRTSGTTRGSQRRGYHLVRDPELYRASLTATFYRFVITKAAGRGRLPIASLVPPFDQAPHSSLSWMADAVVERFGTRESECFAAGAGVDWPGAGRFLARAEERGEPVCLFGTTLAFDEWTRRLMETGRRFRLPDGSVAMDTGGSKGRDYLIRDEVVARLHSCLGLPPGNVVNEFGMTELLSQRYGTPEALVAPPWLRTRSLDPVTLEELPEGETGILNHFDLANAGSVCSVLTEDLGSVAGGRVRWEGRVPGAPPRGCSLATADLLRSQTGTVGEDR